MGQGLLEGPHQGLPLIVFGRYRAGAGIIIRHRGDHHHTVAGAPDLHAFDALGVDVVHDRRPDPPGLVELLVFRDFCGVVDQVQGKAKAAAHFVALSVGALDYNGAICF